MDYAKKNALVFLIPLVVDQITKYWAIKNLATSWPALPFLQFDLIYNRGVTWGLFNSASYFSTVTLIVIAVAAILAVVTVNAFKKNKNVTPQLLVLSGAVSNILDRILHSGVVDFITIHIGDWYWPTFNVADACIVLGVIWMIFVYEE